MTERPAVFLDRDGVVNEVRMDGPVARGPRDVDELEVTAEAVRGLERLRAAGLVLLVVSNQPDVARGEISPAALRRINERLVEVLPIDAVYCCPHDNRQGCGCRKPKPGLILAAARKWDVDLGRSCLIGDRWVDLAAAGAAGIDGILLQRDYSWSATSAGEAPAGLRPCFAGRGIGECVDFILGSGRYA